MCEVVSGREREGERERREKGRKKEIKSEERKRETLKNAHTENLTNECCNPLFYTNFLSKRKILELGKTITGKILIDVSYDKIAKYSVFRRFKS